MKNYKFLAEMKYCIEYEIPDDHFMNFRILECEWFEKEDLDVNPKFKDNSWYGDDPEKANCMFAGFIKWDGCMNIDFNKSNYPLHTCDRQDISNVGQVLLEVYDLARQVIPMADFSEK